MVDLRKYQRTRIDEDVTFRDKDGRSYSGRARDISLGGMFVETTTPLGFGDTLTLQIRLKGAAEPMNLPAIARWLRSDGMGVQFGNLGARETHVITEVSMQDD